MDEQIEEEISKDDNTPSVLDQAHKEGWDANYYNFGKAEGGRDWFNPSIVERDDGIWLLVRGSEPHPQGFRFGQNSIWAFEMDETGKTPKRGIRLHWKIDNIEQHFEDPRGFFNPNNHQTIIGACTFIWYPDGRWTGAHQCIGSFDNDWQCTQMDYPKIGGSPGQLDMLYDKKKYEKNWLPFMHDNKLHILYKANPWHVIGFGLTWSDKHDYTGDGVSWAHGDVRGGTSPVRVGDHYFTFPHSSLPWRGRYRRYYAGAMAFDAKPPFTPRMITPEPLLRGSQNDPWAQKKPLVIFPCGALYKNGRWLITAGINDMKAAWVEIPHEDLLKRMVPIGKSGASVFPVTGLSDAELRLAKLRANAAKARAVKAKKEAVKRFELSEKLKIVHPDKVLAAIYGQPDNLSGGVESRHAGEAYTAAETGSRQSGVSSGSSAPPARNLSKESEDRIRDDIQKCLAKPKKLSSGVATDEIERTPEYATPSRKRIKRRKRRTKAQMAAARLKALKEYEDKKILVSE